MDNNSGLSCDRVKEQFKLTGNHVHQTSVYRSASRLYHHWLSLTVASRRTSSCATFRDRIPLAVPEK